MTKEERGRSNGFDYVRAMLVASKLAIASTPIPMKGGLEFTSELLNAFGKRFETLPLISAPEDFFPALLRHMPNILLIENHFGGIDTIDYAKTLKQSPSCRHMMIYAIARRNNKTLEERCSNDGICGVVYSSSPIQETVNRIFNEYRVHLEVIDTTKRTEWAMPDNSTDITLLDSAADGKIFAGSLIHDMLAPLGLDVNHKGSQYAAIMISLSILGCTDKMNALYEITAHYEKTKPDAVEKALRYAIEQAWTRGRPFMQYHLFGNTIDSEKGKPTNAEFISTIVQHIKDTKYSSMISRKHD